VVRFDSCDSEHSNVQEIISEFGRATQTRRAHLMAQLSDVDRGITQPTRFGKASQNRHEALTNMWDSPSKEQP
jgi:arginine decarboxylase-like protein